MLDNEKLLFDDLYEKTKDCGRVQFVELLMTKERENKELKSQLKGTTHCFDEEEHRKLQENYDRIYAENCKLREEHNINDISLLDENYRLKKVIDEAIEYIKEMTANELNYINYKGKTICICGSDFNSGADIILDILNEVSE